jgi:hypothetical protein
MSEQFETLTKPVNPTTGPPAAKVKSAASAQADLAVEGAEETSARPDFDYAEAATRRNGEW